ncbi:Uncharacterised protein [Macrococcoides caseolyticum]|nr:Uncharacterised protein [Macrococcus caseolyticus]
MKNILKAFIYLFILFCVAETISVSYIMYQLIILYGVMAIICYELISQEQMKANKKIR